MVVAESHRRGEGELMARLIAFYLPQYHPIPENDAWWGRGFTEWTNVTRAHPRFRGHYQPHLPADLGFYDLRVPEVRALQARLAADHGISGFCYYHYWFSGRRLLERPFNEVLSSGEPDSPFCLCWANESWSRAWDGDEQSVLIRQQYSADDDREHIRALFPAFEDDRYIRIDCKPVFLVYRASRLPDPRATTETWREEAERHGLPGLYLARVEHSIEDRFDPVVDGFDAAVEFQPAWTSLGRSDGRGRLRRFATSLGLPQSVYETNRIYSYENVVDRMLALPTPPYKRFPCVTPMWDNSPRRRDGAYIFHGSTPELYERWLRTVFIRFRPPSADENLVFVNAWNEWAEGNHLEPDQRWGMAYLQATKRAGAGLLERSTPSRRTVVPTRSARVDDDHQNPTAVTQLTSVNQS
jgi:lipopolysaccharide biosynthesis protein